MDAQVVGPILFWFLAALVLLPLSLPWSLLAYFLIAHLDMSGPGWASAASVGWENAFKIVVLPTVLLLRARLGSWRFVKNSKTFRVWMAFVLYVAIASLWTPFVLSAVKLIGYLYNYTIIFIVLADAFSKRRARMYKVVSLGLWLSLLLAVFQTYFLGNPFGTSEDRFTSFSSPQSFAAYLVCSLALVLLGSEHGTKGLSSGLFVSAVAVVAILLNGSNTMFLGILIVIACWIGIWTIGKPSYMRMMQLHFGVLVISVVCMGFLLFPDALRGIRATATIHAAIARDTSITDIGTFAWRLSIYRVVMSAISQSRVSAIMFGNGTSSGASLMLRYFNRYVPAAIDANRVLHNELLRIVYEWGVVGFTLFGSFILALVIDAVRTARSPYGKSSWPFLSVVPMLLGLLLVENVLASAGTPEGVGLVLVVSAMIHRERRHSVARGASNVENHGIS